MTTPQRPALSTRIRTRLGWTPSPIPDAAPQAWTALDAPTDEMMTIERPAGSPSQAVGAPDPEKEIWAHAAELDAQLMDIQGELTAIIGSHPDIFSGTHFDHYLPGDPPVEFAVDASAPGRPEHPTIERYAAHIGLTQAALIIAEVHYSDERFGTAPVDVAAAMAAERAIELNGWDRAEVLAHGYWEREWLSTMSRALVTTAGRHINRALLLEITTDYLFAVLDPAAPGGVRELTTGERATLESFDGRIDNHVVRSDGRIVTDHYVAELRRIGLDPEGRAFPHQAHPEWPWDATTPDEHPRHDQHSGEVDGPHTSTVDRQSRDNAVSSDTVLSDADGQVGRTLHVVSPGTPPSTSASSSPAGVEPVQARAAQQPAPQGLPSPGSTSGPTHGPASDAARRGPQR